MRKLFWKTITAITIGSGLAVGWYTASIAVKWVLDRLLTPLVDMAHAETMLLIQNRFAPADVADVLLLAVQAGAGVVIAGALGYVLLDIIVPMMRTTWRKAAE